MTQRLYRSQMDRKIAGVCGGIAEYFDIDPTLVRIAALALIFLHGIGILIYIIAWIAMPKKPIQLEFEKLDMTPPPVDKPSSSQRGLIPGIILIVIGGLILMHNMYWWWFDFDYLFPIILIVIGAIVLLGVIGRKNSHNNMLPQEGTK